ncbi:MAG: dihydrolipoyl dehydrogenase [Desulfovibrionaceae bacterium]|nr:dihydrolipoyl dehydrogenase [Desulfovibrionaceae bacterium]
MRITIIGAGPGGYTAAFDAARRGAEVTLVESDSLGGTCLNRGCIPTKTLKSSAEVLEAMGRCAEFGIANDGTPSVDRPAVIARKRRVSDILRGGLEKTCAKLGIRVAAGRGRIVGADLVQVVRPDGTTLDVPGDRVIVATGSSVMHLPAMPVDGRHVLSSDEALEIDHVPNRLMIVGGGVVGVELAFIFRAFGSQVTIVEGQDRLLPIPSVDGAMSRLLLREAKKKGIRVELCRTVSALSIEDRCVHASLAESPFVAPERIPKAARIPAILEADCLFVTVGRVPNSAGLGLAEAGIATDRRGYIVVNDRLETSVPGIYAIGDILGPQRIMLAHMASAEAHAAVANIFGERVQPDYGCVPSAIFSSPEIGEVGLSEEQAKELGLDAAAVELPFRELGKAQAIGELPGVFKLVADRKTGRLLGAHIAGAHASDLIAECTLALQTGATVGDIRSTIHAHPTLSEGVMEAAALFKTE